MKYVIYIPAKNIVAVYDMSVKEQRYQMFRFMLNNYEGDDTFKIVRCADGFEPVYWMTRSIHGDVVDIDFTDRYGYTYDTVSIMDGRN